MLTFCLGCKDCDVGTGWQMKMVIDLTKTAATFVIRAEEKTFMTIRRMMTMMLYITL